MAHIARLAAPKSWPMKKKGHQYVASQHPGPHSKEYGVPMLVLLRDMLKVASTAREARKALIERKVSVDGKVRVSLNFPVGLFDIVSFAGLNYRILLDDKGRLFARSVSQQEFVKPAKIIRKTAQGKKTQLTTFDGHNIVTDKQTQKVGDTIIFSIPSLEVKETIPFGKGCSILLIRGNHMGEVGNVQDINGNKVIYEIHGQGVFETRKENTFVVGKDKPVIKISEK